MKKLGLLACVLALPVLAGCAYGITPVPDGMFFSAVKYPSYHPAQSDSKGSKEGSASATGFVGLIATGDASVEKAMENGGISKVKTVSHKTTKIFGGAYWKFETIVTGD